MKEILDFLLRHWQLSSAFLVLLAVYLLIEYRLNSSNNKLSPEQLVNMYNHQQAQIIDLRASEAYKVGHITGAQHDIKHVHKDNKHPVILVCSDGKQSAERAKKMAAEGYKQIYTLAGGMQSWHDNNLPTVTKG